MDVGPEIAGDDAGVGRRPASAIGTDRVEAPTAGNRVNLAL